MVGARVNYLLLSMKDSCTYMHTYNSPPLEAEDTVTRDTTKDCEQGLHACLGLLMPLLKRVNNDPIRGGRLLCTVGVSKDLCRLGGDVKVDKADGRRHELNPQATGELAWIVRTF